MSKKYENITNEVRLILQFNINQNKDYEGWISVLHDNAIIASFNSFCSNPPFPEVIDKRYICKIDEVSNHFMFFKIVEEEST